VVDSGVADGRRQAGLQLLSNGGLFGKLSLLPPAFSASSDDFQVNEQEGT
jgi:hypothetical protein